MGNKAQKQEIISIDGQFENYLQRVKLDKNTCSKAQYDETKKAFFAGASGMLVLFQGPIPELPEEEAVVAMEKLVQEAEFYWRVQMM
jgi:hypothetical protein